MRTTDPTPADAINCDLKDGDSFKDSDWRERTGQPLLRLGTVLSDIKPNRKRALIYFKDDEKKLLPVAYAAEEHKRTFDQMMLFLGQSNFVQGNNGNTSKPDRLKSKSGNKRK